MQKKCVIVGSSYVGKTQIFRRFCENHFSDDYKATLGTEFLVRQNIDLDAKDDKTFALQMWDTSGSENFKSRRIQFYLNTDFFILAFDLTSQKSFEDVADWIEEIREYFYHQNFRDPEPKIILLGTKCDLDDKICVKDEVIRKRYPDLIFLKSSAKTGEGIDDAVKKGLSLCVTSVPSVHHKPLSGFSFDTLRHVMSHPAAQIICILLLLAGLTVLGFGIAGFVTSVVAASLSISAMAVGSSVSLISGVSFSFGLFPSAKKTDPTGIDAPLIKKHTL